MGELPKGFIDIWEKKPKTGDGYSALIDVYEAEAMDAFHEKLKEFYAPYHDLLRAEPLMPLDIRSVLKKPGMPVLIDEGWFNDLKKRAETLVFLFGEDGIRMENLMKLQTWRSKAEEWDRVQDILKADGTSISGLLFKFEAITAWYEEHHHSLTPDGDWDELGDVLGVREAEPSAA